MIAPGQRVGHYLIQTRLGAGGMGEVFRAFDESLERPVAIKVLPKAVEGHPEARARMLREARAASALVHANIVTVHEVDEYDGQAILVMELVEGETLSHLLQRTGKRPVAEVLGIVRQVCTALAFAHQAGFVHRDIKSSNLMVMKDGRVKVLDFGLSKRMRSGEPEPAVDTRAMRKPAMPPEVATDPTVPAAPPGADVRTVPGKSGADLGRPPSMPTHDSDARERAAAAARRDDLTVEGAAMGTPGYSALELMDGLPADGRADVFSLGVVIYELLTASRPYTGVDWPGVRAQIVAEKYARARELVPSIPAELDAAIVHALRAERDDRTPSIDALVAELAELDTPGPRRRRRKTVAIALGAAAFAGGTTFAAVKVRSSGGELRGRTTDDAALLALPAADAAVPPDAPPPPPPDAVTMTQTNGCVYAPAFVDEHVVAFDLTTASGARDIVLELTELDGDPPPPVKRSRLTRPGSLDVRPAPGLEPGQMLYVSYDQTNPARSAIRSRALATGAEQEVVPGAHTAIAAQDGAYYYVPGDSAVLRRMREKVDEAVLSLDSAGTLVALVAARDPSKLLISGRIGESGTLCIVDLATSTLDCPAVQEPLGARPDVGSDGTIYYASRGGIRARTAAGDDRMVAPGALASGGLAVSPSGRALVWSDCRPRHALRDTTVKPPADLAVGDRITFPVTGPGGRLAWVLGDDDLAVRRPGGDWGPTLKPLGVPIVGRPSFAPDGEHLVFVHGGEQRGLRMVDFGDPTSLRGLTTDPSDEAPLILADGSVVFTRTVDDHPSVFRMREGEEPAPALTEHRRTVDVDRGSGRVLLRSEDGRYLFWWDPETGLESPGPQTFAPGTDVTHSISLSPDGAWMLYRSGAEGRELWRTSTRFGQPERVTLAADVVVEAAAIDDDGHVLVVTAAMRGELRYLKAPPLGAPF